MTVILTILKVIGWALLILLALVLAALLLVLFCPVRYAAAGSMHNRQTKGRVRASWLFSLVRFHMRFDADGFCMYLRLLGIKKQLSGQDEKKPPKNKKKREKKELPPVSEEKTEEKPQHAQDDDKPREEQHDPMTAEITHESPAGEMRKEKSALHGSRRKKRESVFKKIKRKLQSAKRSIKRFFANIRKWTDIFGDEQNKEAISRIGRELYRLLKSILPKKLSLNATYSAGSPDVTAQVFGILAMFPVGYTNRWRIYPDFETEEAYADGDMDVRGRFRLIRILIPLLCIWFDKNCRRLFHKLNRNC